MTYRSLFSKWANKVKNIESEKKCLWVVDPEKIILYMPLDHRKSKGITKKKKKITSALLTMLKPLTVWITTNYGKFLKRWKYQST